MIGAPVILVRAFYEICLFRKRPQDLPASPVLFWMVLCLYAVISGLLSYPSQTAPAALATGLIEALMLMLITWLFLYLRSVPERWLQTCTALAGTGVIFSAVALPLFYATVLVEVSAALESFISLQVIILVVWNIAVMAYILRHALSSSYFMGVLGSLTYIALIAYTLRLVLVDPATTGI